MPTGSEKATDKVLDTINLNAKDLTKEGDIDTLIVDPLRNNPIFSKLFLRQTRLQAAALTKLLQKIKPHPGIVTVNVRENNLAADQKVFGLLIDSFPNLKELDLNETGLKTKGVVAISKALQRVQNFSKLDHLDIGFNQLGDEGIRPLLEAIQHDPTMISPKKWELRLGGNDLTNKTADLFIQLLKERRLVCSNLVLNNNPKITADKMSALQQLKAETLSTVSPKESQSTSPVLDLSNRDLTANQIPLITTALQQSTIIRKIILSSNSLGDPESLSALWDAISIQGQIDEVDLSDNNIGPDGAAAIAAGLVKDGGLTQLKLSRNKLGAQGGIILSSAIAAHASLRLLDLEKNQLGDGGIGALAEALIGHPSLVSLNVRNNNLRNPGAAAVLRLLQQNGALQRENQEVPLQQVEISQETGINLQLYRSIQLAVRFYGWLPYQRSIYNEQAMVLGKQLLEKDFENTVLEATEAFIREAQSTDVPALIAEYKTKLAEWCADGIVNVESYLKERCRGETLQKTLAEMVRKIEARSRELVDPKTITDWFEHPETSLPALRALAEKSFQEHTNLKEQMEPIAEAFRNIQEEIDQVEAWKLIITPIPAVLPSEGLASLLPKAIIPRKKVEAKTTVDKPSTPIFFVESRAQEQHGWNCFDVAISLPRTELVDFAIGNKKNPEFRKLLAQEIKTAAAMTAIVMNTSEEDEANAKKYEQELSNLFGLLDIAELLNEPSTAGDVFFHIQGHLQQAEENSAKIHNLRQLALPTSMHNARVQALVLDYNNAHEAMKPLLARCNDLLGHPEGRRLSFDELRQFFAADAMQHPDASGVFEEALAGFVPHEKAFHNYCESEETFEAYVNDYYGKEGWVVFIPTSAGKQNTSIVDIAARCLGKEIIIYQLKADMHEEMYRTEYKGTGSVHVQYNASSKHFVALGKNPVYVKEVEAALLQCCGFFKSQNVPTTQECELNAQAASKNNLVQCVMGYLG